MRLTSKFIYAWYRFPEPQGTVYNEADLLDAETACDAFGYVRLGLGRVTRYGWKFLWAHYGLAGLLDLHRRADWCYRCDDEAAAADLVRESLRGGYDPVSGQFGEYRKDPGRFELVQMS